MIQGERIVKFYKINLDNRAFVECKNIDEVVVTCINAGLKKQEIAYKCTIDDLSQVESEGVKYYLFVHNFKEHNSDWADFLPSKLIKHKIPKGKEYALVLFIYDGYRLLATIGGYAYPIVVNFIDHTFGLTLLSKIMDPSEDEIISISSRGLTGLLSGSQQQYRASFKVIDYIRFGRVPTEIHLRLGSGSSQLYFDFLKLDVDGRINVYAGKYFSIKQKLTFSEFQRLVQEITTISELEADDYLNSYSQIPDKDTDKLWDTLIEKIYQNLNSDSPSFDIVNEKIRRFYEAENYILKEKIGPRRYHNFNSTQDRSRIWPIVRRRAIEIQKNEKVEDFKFYFMGLKLHASSSAFKNPLKGNLMYQIDTEIDYEGSVYFLISGKWYKLRKSFVEDLKNQFKLVIGQYLIEPDYLHIPWNKLKQSRESEYNLNYAQLEDYYVLDTIVPDNIELCDILHVRGDTTYLIHVKYGFNSSIRELANQVELAAKRLSDDRATVEKKYLRSVYRQYDNKGHKRIEEGTFLDIFETNRSMVFVLAFASHLKEGFNIKENPDVYRSNIAKYSLITCIRSMQSYNARIEVCQIRNR